MGNYRHKLLVERAMKRLDERTPMGARTPDRFTQKSTTKVPEEIRKKAATASYAVDHSDPEERIKIVQAALKAYNYDDIKETSDKRIVVKNLGFGEVAEDGFVNDPTITAKFKTALTNKIGAVNDKLHHRDYYINTYFDKYPKIDREYGDIFGEMTVIFISRDTKVNTGSKEGQLEGVKVYNQIVSEIKSHLEMLTLEVEKFTDQWDKAYKNTWAKGESIAYADLPWAEKTQTTVNEGKDSEKLFGNKKRLNEAIDRMFEDAVEIGANLKTEEEMMSK